MCEDDQKWQELHEETEKKGQKRLGFGPQLKGETLKEDGFMCLEFQEQKRTHQVAFGVYNHISSAALFVEGTDVPVFLPLPLLDEIVSTLRATDIVSTETHRVVCTNCETYYRLVNNGWTSIVCQECEAEIENPDVNIGIPKVLRTKTELEHALRTMFDNALVDGPAQEIFVSQNFFSGGESDA